MKSFLPIIILFLIYPNRELRSQEYKVLESDENHVKIEFNFDGKFEINDLLIDGINFTSIKDEDLPLQKPGDPYLPTRSYEIGIPQNKNAVVTILKTENEIFNNKFVIATPDSMDQPFNQLNYNQDVYAKNSFFPLEQIQINTGDIFRYVKVVSLSVAPIQFNPVQRKIILNKKIVARVDFKPISTFTDLITNVSDKMTEELIKTNLINSKEALSFMSKVQSIQNSPQEKYWYDPNKEYFKIYLTTKGVYRLSFEYLVSKGLPLISGMPSSSFNIYNNGATVPLDIVDNGDSTFDQGDFIDFVGYPATPTPFVANNIYNSSNVYWLSFQENEKPNRYQNKNGFPTFYNRTFISTPQILHFEKDYLYENLGYADNENRDYWYWGKATAQYRQTTLGFEDLFNGFSDRNLDSNWVTLRVKMHGMTNSYGCNFDHHAEISITDQPLGSIIWDGQREATFEKRFYNSTDSIRIYPSGNYLNIFVKGDTCPDTLRLGDEIRINWYEFEYERLNRVAGTYFNFKSPQNVSGINRYWLWQWQSDSMKILIPQKSEMINNPEILDDIEKTVLFIDTVNVSTEYFCISENSYSLPDSIIRNISSNLRDTTNSADYIIITHPKFLSIANQLAAFRESNFPDENISDPKIEVVDVQQIYNEFSYGLLDPFALQKFVKYAFENWKSQAPSYIVLIGDMSHDYRGLLESSRPNFIPSIPYFASGYGQAASDNMIVAISGNGDVVPDLAIGRISIETVDEGNIILQKIMNYPSDNSKPWKQNVLLLASGVSYSDQIKFGFNQATLNLRNNYISKSGHHSSIVLNYPDTTKPEQEQFRGGGPKIRQEINEGTALVNYYGHGGGYQWDLTFINDDIYTLENQNRLPVILSVTCYTAHFDNQDVFGEQFLKVDGKGCVGFLGSSALTYWSSGVGINNIIFNNIFVQKNYIIGKIVLYAKNHLSSGGINALQIALLSYLGDPVLKLALPDKPDFELVKNNLKISPQYPVVGDSVLVRLNINNWGTTFPNDSVVVELFAETSDTNYAIGSKKIPSFTAKDSISIYWHPTKGGVYTLTAKINENEIIEELDHSDNIISNDYIVFNISDPSILKPIDGFASPNNEIEFIISDIGYYIDKNLQYFIEVDTSLGFTNPVKLSNELSATGSIVRWLVTDLSKKTYFWRTRIFNGSEFGRWSDVRSFSLNNPNLNGYYASKDILKTYSTYNVEYSKLTESLTLNTDTLPARPSNANLIEHFYPDPALPDSLHLTALTTDGTYLYFGNIWDTANLNEGKSKIYKVGTGNNGSLKGYFYGQFSTFRDSIKNSIAYHSDGNIYVAVGLANKLVRINVTTELIDTIDIPAGLLRWDRTNITGGPVYLTSDGSYVYNITLIDSLGNFKYTVRTLDPANSWSMVKPDLVLDGFSFTQGFCGFFVHRGRIYPSEYYNSNFMRRYRLSDGFFEEEWVVILPGINFQSYYSWCYDWTHDNIYASVYRASGFLPKFSKFPGNYIDANGNILTNSVGPVSKWNNLKYDISNPNNSSKYSAMLLGYDSEIKLWDTLQYNIPDSLNLENIDPEKFSSLKLKFELSDSTFNITKPMELKSVHIDYEPLSDLYLEKDDIIIGVDSLMQGFPISTILRAKKIGAASDSLKLVLKQDSTSYIFIVKANSDSVSNSANLNIETNKLLFNNSLELTASQKLREYYYYNNFTTNQFFVSRDSVKPNFTITFDDKELIDGDIISSEPTVVMTVEDNSPLPITQNHFSIQLDNIPLSFYDVNDSLKYNYTPYPNSKAVVTWTPKLEDGSHTLTVFVKDSSGNPFNSSQMVYRFNVFNNPDLLQVYNYPNPFKDKTDFTFEVRGVIPPEELKIKIFTVAGRLIKEIVLPGSSLQIGFNRIPWDGLDQDGDEIANGVYFYKIISKHGNEVKTVTQKLAKLK